MRPTCSLLAIAVMWLRPPAVAQAQFVTVGGGVLLSARSPEPVVELHAETPPLASTRGYVTMSWSDESAKPTLITAGERGVVSSRRLIVGVGAGLLWLDFNDYRPYPVLLSSTALPLPIPRNVHRGNSVHATLSRLRVVARAQTRRHSVVFAIARVSVLPEDEKPLRWLVTVCIPSAVAEAFCETLKRGYLFSDIPVVGGIVPLLFLAKSERRQQPREQPAPLSRCVG